MHDEPTPDDVNALLELIDEQTRWSVEDWTHTNGMFEEAILTVDARYEREPKIDEDEQQSLRKSIRSVVDDHTCRSDGTPVDRVIEFVHERHPDADKSEIRHELQTLKQQGEVYEPADGHLKTT